MWSIKFLTGSQAGQIIPLTGKSYVLGREANCDIVVQSRGVSKHHAQLICEEKKLVVVDKGSSNGTYVNGLRVRQQDLKVGDKIGLFDILIDIQRAEPRPSIPTPPPFETSVQNPYLNSVDQSPQHGVTESPSNGDLKSILERYFNGVIMPEVYKVAKLTDFKWILGLFILSYLVLVTTLSIIPMLEVTQSSIEKESQRRTLTIATSLSDRFKRALQEGLTTTFSTRPAEMEEGVQVALIIDAQDGHVIAPANKRGAYESLPFVNRARKSDQKIVEQIDGSTIGASVPISTFKQESDGFVPTHYAVVLYDMGSMSVDGGRVASLVIKVLAISILLGGILFIFLHKIVENPISDLNFKLDEALRNRGDSVSTDYKIEPLNGLVANINSVLSRAMGGGNETKSFSEDRTQEINNIVLMMHGPSLAVSQSGSIININSAFEEFASVRLAMVQNQDLSVLHDQALRLSLMDLMERARSQVELIATNDLEFSGRSYEIDCQAIFGGGTVQCFVFGFKQKSGDHG